MSGTPSLEQTIPPPANAHEKNGRQGTGHCHEGGVTRLTPCQWKHLLLSQENLDLRGRRFDLCAEWAALHPYCSSKSLEANRHCMQRGRWPCALGAALSCKCDLAIYFHGIAAHAHGMQHMLLQSHFLATHPTSAPILARPWHRSRHLSSPSSCQSVCVSVAPQKPKMELTWDDLQHSVLFHVGWQVARPHLVILNFDGGQFLQR